MSEYDMGQTICTERSSIPHCPSNSANTRMSRFGICLVIICSGLQLTTTYTEPCPTGYVCKWENDLYVLHCNPVVDDYTFQLVNNTIKGIPSNVTRLKITCFSQRITVRLHFSGRLAHVRELTLDTFTVPSDYDGPMFSGIAELSHLTLRNLRWSHMNRTTFDGLVKLRSLFVEKLDDLEYMDREILTHLYSLESLSFKHVGANNDRLTYADYAAILYHISPFNLRSLVMYAVHSDSHPETTLNIDDLFDNGLSSWRMRFLDMGHNNIVNITGNPERSWLALEDVSLAGNPLLDIISTAQFWKQFYALNYLKTIDLSNINQRASSNGEDVFLLTVDEMVPGSVPMILGPRVESVSFRDTVFIADTSTHYEHLCFDARNDTVHYVDLANVRSTKPLTFSLEHLRDIQYLNLQNLSTDILTIATFRNMPDLTTLLLGQNPIGGSMANDSENALFSNNTNLRMLDLSDCQITTIPPEAFAHLHQLLILNLSFNEIATFNVNLNQLTALTLLNISHNILTTLSPSTLKQLDHIASVHTIQVDISGNPLLCLQNKTELESWAETTSVQFINVDKTFCADEKGKQQLYFGVETKVIQRRTEIVHKERASNGWKYGVGASFSGIVVAVLIAIYLWRRYRWKCASYCHHIVKGNPPDDPDDGRTFKRDAFICYNSEDSSWVCHDLLQQLEACQISTVIHHRDFLPGSVLEETIRESVDMSRYTVLVLSPDFLSSNWCLLEMHLARSRITSEGRDVIIPIILREFPMSQLTKTLEGILSKSYLEWTEDPEGQALFWDKLTTKLKQGGNIRPQDI